MPSWKVSTVTALIQCPTTGVDLGLQSARDRYLASQYVMDVIVFAVT